MLWPFSSLAQKRIGRDCDKSEVDKLWLGSEFSASGLVIPLVPVCSEFLSHPESSLFPSVTPKDVSHPAPFVNVSITGSKILHLFSYRKLLEPESP